MSVTDAAATSPMRRRPLYRDLSVQVLIATLLGIVVGLVWPGWAVALRPLGDLFIRLVRMVVAPIIFCTVVHGIASVGQAQRVGRVAIKALIYFEVVTTLALVLGLVLVNVWQPGVGMNIDPAALSEGAVPAGDAAARPRNFGEFLLTLVPASAVGAFADGQVLPVLFFSVLFAFALLGIGSKGAPIVDGIQTLTLVLFKMIGYVMVVAPVGAFGAIAFTVGTFGPSSLLRLAQLVVAFYVCCALFVALVLWPIAWWQRIAFGRLIRYFKEELLIVVGTSSGESVFPRLNAKLRALGCDESLVALVLPAGYAFNHDGTCLYFATVSVFLAQAVGIDLTVSQQLGLLAVMLFTSKGGAGVAGSAIVVLVSTLSASGIVPVAAVGIVVGVHRFLSSAFVPVNVLGNALATIVIAKLEGAVDVARLERELHAGVSGH